MNLLLKLDWTIFLVKWKCDTAKLMQNRWVFTNLTNSREIKVTKAKTVAISRIWQFLVKTKCDTAKEMRNRCILTSIFKTERVFFCIFWTLRVSTYEYEAILKNATLSRILHSTLVYLLIKDLQKTPHLKSFHHFRYNAKRRHWRRTKLKL